MSTRPMSSSHIRAGSVSRNDGNLRICGIRLGCHRRSLSEDQAPLDPMSHERCSTGKHPPRSTLKLSQWPLERADSNTLR